MKKILRDIVRRLLGLRSVKRAYWIEMEEDTIKVVGILLEGENLSQDEIVQQVTMDLEETTEYLKDPDKVVKMEVRE